MAHAVIVPHAIKLIACVAHQIEEIAPFFESGNPEFMSLRAKLRTHADIREDEELSNDPTVIRLVQMLMILSLTMYEGVFVRGLSDFFADGDKVSIAWKSGITDRFTLGVIDDDFITFLGYFQSKVFGSSQREINHTFLKGIVLVINTYVKTVKSFDERVSKLVSYQYNMDELFATSVNQELLFLLLACFPEEQMQSLFMFISQFIPDDLVIKTHDGNEVNVYAFFQSPSTDAHFLIRKTQLYMDLYYSGEYPIIREITQSKTQEFMTSMMENPEVLKFVVRQLISIQENQLTPRLKLYQFSLQQLKRLME